MKLSLYKNTVFQIFKEKNEPNSQSQARVYKKYNLNHKYMHATSSMSVQ